MRKGIAILLLLALLSGLCACGAAESGSQTEPAAAESPLPIETPATLPDTPAPTEEPGPLPAVRVELTREDSGREEKVRITGLDELGRTVWERTDTAEPRQWHVMIEEIGLWQDHYLYNNSGAVICLQLADGSELWRSDDFGGDSISGLIDERNGNVYLCGKYGPDFFACDAEGKTLNLTRNAAEGFYWPGDMTWSGENELQIYYMGGGMEIPMPFYVDLTDFTISWYFGYEDMDANRQYWANVFISDFVEQRLSDFPRDGGSDFELADFAHLFCKINRHEAIVYEDGCETVSLDTVNELCRRFFGREIQPEEGVLHTYAPGYDCRFADGKFYFPAADGESHNNFAVVSHYLRLAGGDVVLAYDIYELDLDEYWDRGMDDALYHLTAQEAEEMAGTGRITCLGYGWAQVLPIEQDGRDGYFLYELHNQLY